MLHSGWLPVLEGFGRRSPFGAKQRRSIRHPSVLVPKPALPALCCAMILSYPFEAPFFIRLIFSERSEFLSSARKTQFSVEIRNNEYYYVFQYITCYWNEQTKDSAQRFNQHPLLLRRVGINNDIAAFATPRFPDRILVMGL